MSADLLVSRVNRIEGRWRAMDWPWASANRAAIQAHWEERQAAKPKIFNGRVLIQRRMDWSEAQCSILCSEVDFADFIAWMDWRQPDPSVANVFATAALQGSDGAFICGVMAEHTVNPGRIYFAGGTPDRSDLRPDGTVDFAASLTRELAEETGLFRADYRILEPWIMVHGGPTVALIRYTVLHEPADSAAERIRRSLAAQPEPELADVRIIRSLEDIDPQIVLPYVQSFLRWHFLQR